MTRYANRAAAGRDLARAIKARGFPDPVILGIPRGGVPVAHEVAVETHAPLDVIVARKVALPEDPELALGAVARNVTVRFAEAARSSWAAAGFSSAAEAARAEVARRELAYRSSRAPLELAGKTAILVDDGLATGATMVAAIRAAREAGAARVVAAAPVASREAAELVRKEADESILLEVPAAFWAVGEWYEEFPQVENDTVLRLMQPTARR